MSGLPAEALVASGPRRVLVFADLPLDVRMRLRGRGAELTHAESELGAIALLADRDFDAAVLDMTLSAELVKRLKANVGQVPGVDDALCARARERQRTTPFFLVTSDERRYTVVVDPPEHSYVERGDGPGLVDAVMALDVGKLVMRGAARA